METDDWKLVYADWKAVWRGTGPSGLSSTLKNRKAPSCDGAAGTARSKPRN